MFNEGGASTRQESDEAETGHLNVIVNYVLSYAESGDNSETNLANHPAQKVQWTSSDILCPFNELGKVRRAGRSLVSKLRQMFPYC